MPARRREPLARDLPAELQVAATNGSILTDSRGKKYIDFVMGWCVGNFGWRPEAIAKAIERFKGPDYVYPGYSYAPWTELARLLASLAPRPLTTCFRATGGSEAVDLALQAAMIHTGRRGLLSLEGSYHGNSLAGLSIGTSDTRERIKNLLPHCDKIAPPLDTKAVRRSSSG
jgi:4-aminobutyrate aminotransferase-like enzyme